MRGCDGNSSAWNGSYGSGDSNIQGISTMKKLQVGAYVVNSNSWVGDYNGFNHADNSQDLIVRPPSNHYRSKRPPIPDTWQRKSMDSRDALLYYPSNQSNTGLNEKLSSNFVNSANFRTKLNSSGTFPVQPSNVEDRQNSVPLEDFGSERSINGSCAGNIYQGTMVRITVPELYSEVGESNGNAKGNGSVIAYRQDVSKNKNLPHEARNTSHEVYSSAAVPVETYRRINDWLRNCQQFADDTTPKTSQSVRSAPISQKVNNSGIEKIKQQQVFSASKPSYGASVHSGAVSNFGYSEEPRIVAGLESKYARTQSHANSSGHYQRNTNFVWSEPNQSENPNERQRSRHFEGESIHVSSLSYTPQRNRTYFEHELSPTSSEWSSDSLSVTGSDKSSYCTDFTPHELGKNVVLRTSDHRSGFEFENEYATVKRKSIFVSEISIEGKPYGKNGMREIEFPQKSKKQSKNAQMNEKSNSRFDNYVKRDNPESKYWQNQHQSTSFEEETKLKITKSNLPVRNSQAPVVNVVFGEDQRSQLSYDASFVIESENQARYKQHQSMLLPDKPKKLEKGSKMLDESSHNIARTDFPMKVTKRNKEERNRPTDFGVERPRSLNVFAEKEQPLSLLRDNIQVNEEKRPVNSRPVTQLKNGSLSITIRPKNPTAFDAFKSPDGGNDSLNGRDEFSQKEIKKQSDNVVMKNITNKPSETLGNLESIPTDDDSASECSSETRDSEKLDTYTRTFIQSDVPAKVTHKPSRIEHPLKLDHRPNLPAKPNQHSSALNEMPKIVEQEAYENKKIQINSEFNENTDSKDAVLSDFQLSPHTDENLASASRSSTVLSSDSSSKTQNVKKISALKRIFKKAKSYMGEKLGDGVFDHDSKRKNTSVTSLEGENKMGTQNKISEFFGSLTAGRSKSRCKHMESSFEENQVSTPDNNSERHLELDAYSPHENHNFEENMSQECGYKSAQIPVDRSKSDDDLQETRSGNETSSSIDTLLVSLQANPSQELPEFNEFSKPQLQALDHTSQFKVEPNFREDLETGSLEHSDDYSEEDHGSRHPEDSEVLRLEDVESTGNQDTHSVGELGMNSAGESQVFESTDSTFSPHEFTLDYKGMEDSDCHDSVFALESDSSLVSEVLKAFDDIQRKGRELLDSKSESLCSEPRENIDDGRESDDESEQVSCQDFVELNEDLVIEPPTSFSDFTIML